MKVRTKYSDRLHLLFLSRFKGKLAIMGKNGIESITNNPIDKTYNQCRRLYSLRDESLRNPLSASVEKKRKSICNKVFIKRGTIENIVSNQGSPNARHNSTKLPKIQLKNKLSQNEVLMNNRYPIFITPKYKRWTSVDETNVEYSAIMRISHCYGNDSNSLIHVKPNIKTPKKEYCRQAHIGDKGRSYIYNLNVLGKNEMNKF